MSYLENFILHLGAKYNSEMRETPWQKFEKTLDGYRKGFCDKMTTIGLIGQIRSELSSDLESFELARLLIALYRNSDMANKTAGGYMVNESALAVSCLAEFYPAQRFTELVFSSLQTCEGEKLETWAQVIVPEFQWNLTRYPQRFTGDVISQIKAFATLVRNKVPPYSSTVLSAVDSLERTAEYKEFERFATSLLGRPAVRAEGISLEESHLPTGLDQTVAAALRRADEHLRSPGEFDPKSAADLIRSAMDEAHRIIVKQLETIKGKPYDGGEKDGARRIYMRSVDFINEPEERFFSAIYSLISQEGSHKLIAPRETVLLLHQTVSNYLRLLTERLNREVR